MTEEKEANENHDSDTETVENENAKNNGNQGFVLHSKYTQVIYKFWYAFGGRS